VTPGAADGSDSGQRSASDPGRDSVSRASALLEAVRGQVERRVIGRRRAVNRLLVGLIAGGHVLIEGVPGLGKTLLARTLAEALDARFSRIQFTPDLLPADLTGTLVWNERTGEFRPREGPVFANLVLADEVNRAPAKVQSALLEAMQERQVTIGEKTHPLPEPFLVMATQNPIEQEGTYRLPEAQVDRFTFKVVLEPPDRDDERRILRGQSEVSGEQAVEPVADPADVLVARGALDRVEIAGEIEEYVLDLVRATRRPGSVGLEEIREWVEHGASPRATLHLARASRGTALLDGRSFVVPEDVRRSAADVLRHRLVLSHRARVEEVSAGDVLGRLTERVAIP